MNDDQDRLDTETLDMPTHDWTPDLSLDTAMSIREAATRADVTEKTIRRWIKSGRLHAIKLGGQYRITEADLEVAKAHDAHVESTQRPDTGHDSPQVDASTRPGSEHGQGRQQSESIDLAPLVNHIADLEKQIGQLTQATTMWQIRAMQAEQRIEALTATIQEPDEPVSEDVESPQNDESTLQGIRAWLHRIRGR